MSDAPMTFARFAYGLIGLSVIGFVIGAVYAWLYNRLCVIDRSRG